MSTTPNEQTEQLNVPMDRVVRFVRQLSHDLRNHLNAAELQAAFMNEIAADEELKGEIVRLRAMLSEMTGALQRVSGSLAPPRLTRMPYEAEAFAEDLQRKIESQFPEQKASIDWQVKTGGAMLDIDPQLLQQVFVELFTNAFLHDRAEERISFTARMTNGAVEFVLREPKKEFRGPTEQWGREPFGALKHGHYGVGLHRARRIVEDHGGTFAAEFDDGAQALTTRVTLPAMNG